MDHAEAIMQAPSLDVLKHIRESSYADLDWSQLTEEYDAKAKALAGDAP